MVRVGRTVDYPSLAGLVTGKKLTIISTRGGADSDSAKLMMQLDAQVPYLKQILGFIGITDVSVVYASNLAASAEARQGSLDRALTEVEKLASQAGQDVPSSRPTALAPYASDLI